LDFFFHGKQVLNNSIAINTLKDKEEGTKIINWILKKLNRIEKVHITPCYNELWR